jgi:hypothetical protein
VKVFVKVFVGVEVKEAVGVCVSEIKFIIYVHVACGVKTVVAVNAGVGVSVKVSKAI